MTVSILGADEFSVINENGEDNEEGEMNPKDIYLKIASNIELV